MAGQYYTGTLLASPIVRGSSGDTYGTHHSVLGVGGYMEVPSLTARNSLPIDTVNGIGYDGISSGQRRLGMLVYVHADDTIYQLSVAQSTWSGLTSAGKLTALANNSNWIVFVAGGADNNGERIEKAFVQTTHGFVVGDAVAYDGADFVKANNVDAYDTIPLGLVSEVSDADNFKITFSGYISTAGIVDYQGSGLTGGTLYFLAAPPYDGKLTAIRPTGNTNVNKPMLIATESGYGVVLQYRGIYDNEGSFSYDLFTGYTATTQVFLNKTVTGATNLAYFTGYTGVQRLPINHLTKDAFDGTYASLYNNYYRDNLGYIRIGAASDGIARRGYLRSTPLPKKSWIWNEYTGDGASVGWVFINADVSLDSVYGTRRTGSTNMEFSLPEYTATTWTESNFYNNGSQVVVNTVLGNLATGSTYYTSGPVYKDKVDKKLRLRTIVSKTPTSLKVQYDDYFIKLSGHTNLMQNVGGGIGIYSGTTGQTFLLKSLVGGGDTTVTNNGNQIIISSTGGGGTSASGENVTKRITKLAHGFAKGNAIGWSGGVYSKAIADGTYDGEIVGIVKSVVSPDVFDLTQSGYVTGLTGFVTNSTYFVSPTVAGALTFTSPTTVGHLVKPMFVANSATSGWVLPYPGYVISPPVTGGTSSGGTAIYTGASPSNITVGGMLAGTTLTGRTLSSILEEILITTYYPTINDQYNTFNDNVANSYEVGTVIDIDFTAGFNKGSIYLGATFQDYRSGDVNCYYYTGTGLPATVGTTSLSDVQSVSGVTVPAGTCTWTSCVGYDCGPQPLDSDGCDSGSPLPSGITSAISTTVTGIYPYYWGTYASGGAPAGSNRPASTNNLVTGGTKVLASSNGTICVTFGSTSDDYLWFAIPTGSTSKTCWYVDEINNEKIEGGIGPGCCLFPLFTGVSICSAQSCWSNVPYKVYVSNYQSAISAVMQIRNS